MRKISPTEFLNPWVVIAAVVLIANLVGFAVWTAPRWRAQWNVSGVAGQVEDARHRIEPALQAARDSYGRVVTAEADFGDFQARLTNLTSGADLMTMLVRAGASVGIDLEAAWDASFQLDNVDGLGVVQLHVSLPVVGSYDSVRRFLDELAALPIFLVIDGINLQSADAVDRPGGSPAQATAGSVRLDLALSVFLPDPQAEAALTTPPPAAAPPESGASSLEARADAQLRAASRGNDPEALADAIAARLALLAPLPVGPDSLVLHLERLESPPAAVAPRRNLFSAAKAYVPPVVVERPPPTEVVEPEPTLPVQLRGVMRIGDVLHASLSDGVDIFVVKAGDHLPNGVEIIEVGADYVEVLFRDERTRLSLEGSQS